MIRYTERLTLLPLGTEHFTQFHSYASDPDNTRLMLFMPMDDETETMAYLAERESQWRTNPQMIYEFAVLLDDVFIGSVSLDILPEEGCGELGWILDKRYWGHGYAAEAARAVTELAFGTLHLNRLIAHCDSENLPSRRVMEKLGMTLVSITSGRYNRSSAETRQECLYEMALGT